MNVSSATILICTYNRAHHLRETLRAIRDLDAIPDCAVEVVVVDNNSGDNTAAVVAEASSLSDRPIVYLHEVKQGKSFALNLGLSRSTGEILALTDDDVIPARDWLARIVGDFRERDVTFVFGKVLPRWGSLPPPELLASRAQAIWGPLALVDYGDQPQPYSADHTGQRLPIGANVAFSSRTLETVGGWRTDLGKVNNSLISGEDHEIFMRLRRASSYRGFYDPKVVVRHYVPAARLTRRYFRRWFFWHGKTEAMMLSDLYPNLDLARVPKVAGVPRFLYRQAFQQFRTWLRTLGRRDALQVFIEELRVMQFAGLFAEGWRRYWKAIGPEECGLEARTSGEKEERRHDAPPVRSFY